MVGLELCTQPLHAECFWAQRAITLRCMVELLPNQMKAACQLVVQAHSWIVQCSPSSLRAHGVVVSHPLRMRKALGSNPSVSNYACVWLSLPQYCDCTSQCGQSTQGTVRGRQCARRVCVPAVCTLAAMAECGMRRCVAAHTTVS